MSTFGGKPPEGYDEQPGSFNNPPRMDNRGLRLPPVDGPQPDADGFLQPQRKVHRPFGHLPQYDPNTGAGRPLGEARSIAEFTIVAVGHDALGCTDDGEGDDKVLVAKPWQFRRGQFDGKTFGTTAYASTALDERTATPEGEAAVTETVGPSYVAGEKILAAGLRETVDVPVGFGELLDVRFEGTYQADWVDLNTAGRDWATEASATEEIYCFYQLDSSLTLADGTIDYMPFVSADETENVGSGFSKTGSESLEVLAAAADKLVTIEAHCRITFSSSVAMPYLHMLVGGLPQELSASVPGIGDVLSPNTGALAAHGHVSSESSPEYRMSCSGTFRLALGETFWLEFITRSVESSAATVQSLDTWLTARVVG